MTALETYARAAQLEIVGNRIPFDGGYFFIPEEFSGLVGMYREGKGTFFFRQQSRYRGDGESLEAFTEALRLTVSPTITMIPSSERDAVLAD
jgi:hypothetical protein